MGLGMELLHFSPPADEVGLSCTKPHWSQPLFSLFNPPRPQDPGATSTFAAGHGQKTFGAVSAPPARPVSLTDAQTTLSFAQPGPSQMDTAKNTPK